MLLLDFITIEKVNFFFDSAMKMILKESSVDDIFYIAPSLNELVLNNLNLEIYTIPTECYHNFYSIHKVREFNNNH